MSPLNLALEDLIAQVEAQVPDASALSRVRLAQFRVRTLADLGDQLVGHFVDQARREGASWSQIGDALGVSKQAAQQRGVPHLFERYTARARHAVVLAQERARGLGHGHVGTEHLLLGLLGESDGVAARALAALAGSARTVEEAVAAAITPGTDNPPSKIPFTARGTQALSAAAEQAQHLGHDFVGTEHLLLALFAQPDSVATRVLAGLDITHDKAKTEVLNVLATL